MKSSGILFQIVKCCQIFSKTISQKIENVKMKVYLSKSEDSSEGPSLSIFRDTELLF